MYCLIFLSSCTTKPPFNFQGKWQSLNDAGLALEIDENDGYTLYRDQRSMQIDIVGFGPLKIEIDNIEGPWRGFELMSIATDSLFSKGRIEIVSDDRIRIYWKKHHDILDLADEFHRADDFNSFSEILDEISNSPEE